MRTQIAPTICSCRPALRAASSSLSRHQPDPRTVHARPWSRRRCSPAARAARARPARALTSILQPFNRLLVSWSGKGEAGQLTAAEFDGAVSALPPDRLVSGFYLNELLLKLFARHDSHPDVFVSVRRHARRRSRSMRDGVRAAAAVREAPAGRARLRARAGARCRDRRAARCRATPITTASTRARCASTASRKAPIIFSGSTLLALAREDSDRPGRLRRGASAAACRAGSLPGRPGAAHAGHAALRRRSDA